MSAAGGKSKKQGRSKDWCKAYRARSQRERNKITRLTKHLSRLPGDLCAKAAIERARKVVRGF